MSSVPLGKSRKKIRALVRRITVVVVGGRGRAGGGGGRRGEGGEVWFADWPLHYSEAERYI